MLSNMVTWGKLEYIHKADGNKEGTFLNWFKNAFFVGRRVFSPGGKIDNSYVRAGSKANRSTWQGCKICMSTVFLKQLLNQFLGGFGDTLTRYERKDSEYFD